jgi:hypothetical protein
LLKKGLTKQMQPILIQLRFIRTSDLQHYRLGSPY